MIKIDSNIIQFKINIRVLEVQIDTRLKWDSHVRKIHKKMMKQIMILIKMSTFTWNAIFRKTRILYTFVVRSIFIYETAIWHTLKTKKTRIINKLVVIQNRCLRSIFEVFRVTLFSILEIETYVALIDLLLGWHHVEVTSLGWHHLARLPCSLYIVFSPSRNHQSREVAATIPTGYEPGFPFQLSQWSLFLHVKRVTCRTLTKIPSLR